MNPGRTLTEPISQDNSLVATVNLAQPAAMMKRCPALWQLGAGLDPMWRRLQVSLISTTVRNATITFRLGAAKIWRSQALIRRFRTGESRRAALAAVHEFWNHTLGSINVDNDPAVNAMANGWFFIPNACLSALGSRTGFYQSGGAYGFRDQLPGCDGADPCAAALTREHLLRAAAHQFVEGDVRIVGIRRAAVEYAPIFRWTTLAAIRDLSLVSNRRR
jgi:cellobiose phosphorylase